MLETISSETRSALIAQSRQHALLVPVGGIVHWVADCILRHSDGLDYIVQARWVCIEHDEPAGPPVDVKIHVHNDDIVSLMEILLGDEAAVKGKPLSEVALAWFTAGITPEQAEQYLEVGAHDPDAVAELISEGITPDHLTAARTVNRVAMRLGGNPDEPGFNSADYIPSGSLAAEHSSGNIYTSTIVWAVRCGCGHHNVKICDKTSTPIYH